MTLFVPPQAVLIRVRHVSPGRDETRVSVSRLRRTSTALLWGGRCGGRYLDEGAHDPIVIVVVVSLLVVFEHEFGSVEWTTLTGFRSAVVLTLEFLHGLCRLPMPLGLLQPVCVVKFKSLLLDTFFWAVDVLSTSAVAGLRGMFVWGLSSDCPVALSEAGHWSWNLVSVPRDAGGRAGLPAPFLAIRPALQSPGLGNSAH